MGPTGGEGPGRPHLISFPRALLPPRQSPSQPPRPSRPNPPPPRSLRLSWASCPPASLQELLPVLGAGQPGGLRRRPCSPQDIPKSPDGAVEVGARVGQQTPGMWGNASALCAENRGPTSPSSLSRETPGAVAHRPPTQMRLHGLWPPPPPRPTLGRPGQLGSALRRWGCQTWGPRTSAHTRPTQGLGQETLAQPWLSPAAPRAGAVGGSSQSIFPS